MAELLLQRRARVRQLEAVGGRFWGGLAGEAGAERHQARPAQDARGATGSRRPAGRTRVTSEVGSRVKVCVSSVGSRPAIPYRVRLAARRTTFARVGG